MSFQKDNNIQRSKELSILIYSNGLSFLVKEDSSSWGETYSLSSQNFNDELKSCFDSNAIFSFAFRSVKIYLQKSEYAIAPMAYFLPKELAIYFNKNVTWDYEITKNGSLGNIFFLQAIPLNLHSFLHQRFHNLEIIHPGYEVARRLHEQKQTGTFVLSHNAFNQKLTVQKGELLSYSISENNEDEDWADIDFFIGQKPSHARGKVLGYSQVLAPDLAEIYS